MDYETRTGKADLSRYVPSGDLSASAWPTTTAAPAPPASAAYGSRKPRHVALREYAARYSQPRLSSVVLSENFQRLAASEGRTAEAHVWMLMHDVLRSAEEDEAAHPDAIGLARVAPWRRWFTSHYAILQDLLMRQPLLRRANIICRWLEQTYREGQREARLIGKDDVVVRQLILTHIRGGSIQRAIDAAVTYRDCAYSCIMSAAHLQAVKEPWFSQTSLVPLFGEYGGAELGQQWCGNEHRMSNLAQLFEDSSALAAEAAMGGSPTRSSSAVQSSWIGANATCRQFDKVIAAALCGHAEVLEPAMQLSGGWKDIAWCVLRCALVVAFSKAVLQADTVPPDCEAYAAFVERTTGGGEDWCARYMETVAAELTSRLCSTALPAAPLEEQLQMRFMLQVLSPDSVELFDVRPERGNSEAARLVSHVLLALDVAYQETLISHAVQAYAADSLAEALAEYARAFVMKSPCDLVEGMQLTVGMARRLRDPRLRASVYAAYVMAARDRELQREELSRAAIEEQEATLVRVFVAEDAVPLVHEEVQRLLHQRVDGAAQLLTHHPMTEDLMWQAMHADTADAFLNVFRRGLEACVGFWLATPAAELDAITDVCRILDRRVMPQLHVKPHDPAERADEDAGVILTRVTPAERDEFAFWHLFTEAREVAQAHTRIAGELGVALATGSPRKADQTLNFQLRQDEAALVRRLRTLTEQAVRYGGAVVRRARQCVTAVVWLVQQLAEDLTLSLLVSKATTAQDELWVMQCVAALVEELSEAGYLEPDVLPQPNASDLYSRIRTLRVTYGRRVHRIQVQSALQKVSSVE